MKTAYSIVRAALNDYRTHYDNLDPHVDGDDKTVADFILAAGFCDAGPTTTARVLRAASKYVNVFDPDIYTDDAMDALKKVKRDLR